MAEPQAIYAIMVYEEIFNPHTNFRDTIAHLVEVKSSDPYEAMNIAKEKVRKLSITKEVWTASREHCVKGPYRSWYEGM